MLPGNQYILSGVILVSLKGPETVISQWLEVLLYASALSGAWTTLSYLGV